MTSRAAGDRVPFRATPMLATLVDEPVELSGWVNEEKYDGYRILAYKEGTRVTLLSRKGNDRTERFASVARAVARLPVRTILLDGEAVAFDRDRVSRFQLLQQGESPIVFAAFDCLYLDGRDLRAIPLHDRRIALLGAIPQRGPLFPARRLPSQGARAYAVAQAKGFEGMVAKDDASLYVPGRSRAWRKVKIHQEEEFVIGGFTAPAGSRMHLGALLLGAYDGPQLRYVGKVGTGFDHRTLEDLAQRFRRLTVAAPAFAPPPRDRNATWLAPKLVAQIAFTEFTADKRLRHPVFLGLRDDKRPAECRMPSSPT